MKNAPFERCIMKKYWAWLALSIKSAISSANNVTFLIILWLGIITIVLMCLYPPWLRYFRITNTGINSTIPEGCALLWQPPKTVYLSAVAIDHTRLLIQIFIVGLITGGLLFTVRTMSIKKE